MVRGPIPIELRSESLDDSDPRLQGFSKVESWQSPDPVAPLVELYRAGPRFCLWSPDNGSVRFELDGDSIVAVAAPGVAPGVFEQFVRRSWLPAIYPALGRQVLHASAAYHLASGAGVAFTGPSHVGKSTIAYALGQKDGWCQLADDVLAFTIDRKAERVELAAIPDDRRLRDPVAQHLGQTPQERHPLAWPDSVVTLGSLVFLEPLSEEAAGVEIEGISSAGAFTELLAQAFSPSIQPRDLRERLVEDFLEFASLVDFFRVRYSRQLEFLEPTVAIIAESVLK